MVETKARSLLLVGNPNVGKSVIFHALTGHYVTAANYPGTTVDVSRGDGVIGSETYHVIDSPGINALTAAGDEEKVTQALFPAANEN
ncbi:MAG: FeoB small GTPase domain-containing protein [Elusimicrobiota bacterium]